jgi:hypothetical protein
MFKKFDKHCNGFFCIKCRFSHNTDNPGRVAMLDGIRKLPILVVLSISAEIQKGIRTSINRIAVLVIVIEKNEGKWLLYHRKLTLLRLRKCFNYTLKSIDYENDYAHEHDESGANTFSDRVMLERSSFRMIYNVSFKAEVKGRGLKII